MIPTVLLVEDHTLVRAGIRSLLEGSSQVKVIGEANTGLRALELCRELNPDVVLSDVEMPDMNGIEMARQIVAAHSATRVLMVSMYGDQQYVVEALRAGASGYVLKDAAITELLAGIQAVVAGRLYLSPSLTDVVMEDYVRRAKGEAVASELDKLTAREREVVQLIAEGHSSSEAARLLHISARTIDAHRSSAMQKLDIHSIASLTKFAINHGLTSARRG